MVKCFFNVFCSFLGRNPSYCVTWLISNCMGVALHIFCIVSNIFWIILFIYFDAICYYFNVS